MNISVKNPRWWPAPKRSCTPKIVFSSLTALIIGAFMGYLVLTTYFGYRGMSCPVCPNVTELTEKFTQVERELKQSQAQVVDLTKQLNEARRKPSEPVPSCPTLPPPAMPPAPCQSCLDTTEQAEKLKKLEVALQNKELQVSSLRVNLDGCNSLLEGCKRKTCWLDRFNDTINEIFRKSE